MNEVVVDSSAIVAVLLGESDAPAIEAVLLGAQCRISAANWVEVQMVVEARSGTPGVVLLEELAGRIELAVEPVTDPISKLAVSAWRRFGKGRHPAGLNFGDVFAYATARHLGLPLLFVGEDFNATDIESALAA